MKKFLFRAQIHPRPARQDRALLAGLGINLGLALCLCAFTACASGGKALDTRARSIINAMENEEKIGQLFMVSVFGNSRLSNADKEFLRLFKPGAVLFFGFNVSAGPRATRDLTADIQDCLAPSALPALIAIDHEGGTVYRFKDHLSRLPAAREVGRNLSLKQTQNLGAISGKQLRALGINLNLAPIAEPEGDWNRDFLGSRAYSEDPKRAADYAAAFARGNQSARVAATLKHFPGNASTDPHHALPHLDLSAKDLDRLGIQVFKRALAASNAKAVMLSHVQVQALDPDNPASLSPAVIGLLKKRLGFRGLVITDDLEMKALTQGGTVADNALKALIAGADILMISSRQSLDPSRRLITAALASGKLPAARLDDALMRIVKLKLSLGLMEERDPALRQAGFETLGKNLEEGRELINALAK